MMRLILQVHDTSSSHPDRKGRNNMGLILGLNFELIWEVNPHYSEHKAKTSRKCLLTGFCPHWSAVWAEPCKPTPSQIRPLLSILMDALIIYSNIKNFAIHMQHTSSD